MRLSLSCLVLMLGACTYQAQVPIVDGTSLANVGGRQSGQYAALVQTGGWDMKTEVVGNACSAHTYQADLNGSWDQAMRSALSSALEKVDFVPSLPPADQMRERGYDAELGLTQSNASSRLTISPKFWTAAATAETKLEGILTIQYPDGTRQQEPLQGQGSTTNDVSSCGDVKPIEQSSALAIKDLVQRAVITTKLLLAQKKAN
jgi:hypothetical protein